MNQNPWCTLKWEHHSCNDCYWGWGMPLNSSNRDTVHHLEVKLEYHQSLPSGPRPLQDIAWRGTRPRGFNEVPSLEEPEDGGNLHSACGIGVLQYHLKWHNRGPVSPLHRICSESDQNLTISITFRSSKSGSAPVSENHSRLNLGISYLLQDEINININIYIYYKIVYVARIPR